MASNGNVPRAGGNAGVEPGSWLRMGTESPRGAWFSTGVSAESGPGWWGDKGTEEPEP